MELQTMPLKFRVWDKEGKKLIYNAELAYDYLYPDHNPLYVHNFYELIKDDRYIISQDTGLKDKNGKSIFTGDILFSGIYYVEVRYEDGEVVGYIPKNDVYCDFLEQMQLRGNIWQNPELLEEK